MLNRFESIFMTNHSCIGCGREIPDGTEFQMCDDCKKGLKEIKSPVCEKCGEMVVENNRFCMDCEKANYKFDCNRSYCYYMGVSATIVKKLKYGKRKYIAKNIAEMMTADRLFFEDVDMIAFVPIHKKRLKERGFNQAKEIAEEISKIVGIKFETILFKRDNSKHQAGLKQSERLENLKNSFEINPEIKEKVKDKVVLIVDDVFTTGATLSECAAEIKKLKPKKVKTLTFAKTKFEFGK